VARRFPTAKIVSVWSSRYSGEQAREMSSVLPIQALQGLTVAMTVAADGYLIYVRRFFKWAGARDALAVPAPPPAR
jgi:hypothetical protein